MAPWFSNLGAWRLEAGAWKPSRKKFSAWGSRLLGVPSSGALECSRRRRRRSTHGAAALRAADPRERPSFSTRLYSPAPALAAAAASPSVPSSPREPPPAWPPPSSSLPWHFLYFLPEPHGHGS